MTLPATGEYNMVVARFNDGHMIKGMTLDFSSSGNMCHILQPDKLHLEGKIVFFKDLKALFFVNSLEGNPEHKTKLNLNALRRPGERFAVVKFRDGEIVTGGAVGEKYKNCVGFFICPADHEDNNQRIFAIRGAVQDMRVLTGRQSAEDAYNRMLNA